MNTFIIAQITKRKGRQQRLMKKERKLYAP